MARAPTLKLIDFRAMRDAAKALDIFRRYGLAKFGDPVCRLRLVKPDDPVHHGKCAACHLQQIF